MKLYVYIHILYVYLYPLFLCAFNNTTESSSVSFSELQCLCLIKGSVLSTSYYGNLKRLELK